MTLNEFVSIQSQVLSADSYGGQAVTWETTYTAWAEVKAVKGREEERLGRLSTVETYLVKIRYLPSITTDMRLVWGDKQMDIRSAQDREGHRRIITLECEVVANG